MEFEPGGVNDLRAALERLIPREGDYEHNRLNARHQLPRPHARGDRGAVRDAPVADGDLVTGTWQQIVLLDFDDRPRERRVLVQVLG